MSKQFRFMDYVNQFEEGERWGRAEVARCFGVTLPTATYHLERAVKAGELNKVYGRLGYQSGWLYALPSTMPRMEGV